MQISPPLFTGASPVDDCGRRHLQFSSDGYAELSRFDCRFHHETATADGRRGEQEYAHRRGRHIAGGYCRLCLDRAADLWDARPKPRGRQPEADTKHLDTPLGCEFFNLSSLDLY